VKYYEEAQQMKKNAPWYVVPADDKDMCRYIVGNYMERNEEIY
jgi:polyphosphate kinase 2 (PPK2 family)